MPERKKIGELLVEGKVITSTQLTSALAHQRQWGGRLGTALIEKGFLTEDVLAKFLSFQLNFPSVNLTKIQVQSDVLARVPREIQEKYLCVPIAVMKEGRTDALILAIADPTDLHAIDEIGFATGLKVKPVVATESALKRFLFGAQTGGVRNVALQTPSGFKTIHEKTDEFEVVRGSTAPGDRVPGVVGEETIDFDSDGGAEFSGSGPVIAGTIQKPATPPPPPAAKPAPPAPAPPPARAADPFAAAVIARASGGEAAPMGSISGPIPGGMPVVEGSLPTLDPGALSALAPSGVGAVPSPNGFETDDRTEPEIVMAGGSPPPVPEPDGSAPWDAAPPAAAAVEQVAPAPENTLLDAWEEPPQPAGDAAPTGAVPTDVNMDEISLPGPEMLPPPPEILEAPIPADAPVPSPSKMFSVPEDVPIAEASAAAPPPPADEVWEPEPEQSWEPKPEAWEPKAEEGFDIVSEPQPQTEAEGAPAGFVESGFEPTVPDSEMAPPDPPASLDPPMPEEKPAPAAPLATDGGAVPASLDPADEQERTVIGSGAMEPTWSGEESDLHRSPEKTVLGQGAAEPMWTPGEHTETAESLPGPKAADVETSDRETAESFELPPPKKVPPPAPNLSVPPSQEKTFLKPPAVKVEEAVPPESSEPSKPISDEQAALNVTITKKLKLLNAIAELLLEKGLISEEEIKEKIAKKK